jgi:hypothetical protein
VKIPSPPGSQRIPPPPLTGAAGPGKPDLSFLSFRDLKQQTSLPQNLCMGIARARGGGSFASVADFKRRLDKALRELNSSYQSYESKLIENRSSFVLNGDTLLARDLKWP